MARMTNNEHRLIPATFTQTPSLSAGAAIEVSAVAELSPKLDAVGFFVGTDGDVPAELGLARAQLAALGFEGKAGQTHTLLTASGDVVIAVGIGAADAAADATAKATATRDAAASFARAASTRARIGLVVPGASAAAIGVLAEGVLLARYRYNALKATPRDTDLEVLEVAGARDLDAANQAITTARVAVRAANVTRDLANTPPGHLTATNIADRAVELGAEYGFKVEVFGKAELIELGCGGLLGVNAGSIEEPRMVKMTYAPASPTAHIALVGKGIMYDSGGISLKPSDPMHLLMKMDMGGAAAVLGAFTALRDSGASVEVTGYLMCTDNMPSGSATMLGDVLTAANGTTVEVKNTDAEGRLVMMDALALAARDKPDAIVDIATLTGAALMALGQSTAAVLGNNQAVVNQLLAAAAVTDEPAWQLPLEKKYRKQLDSDIADISNLGGKYAGATTAALFLNEFVDGVPWAHLDIAGTMQSDADDSWRSQGSTGYGARLLAEFVRSFEAPIN